MRALIALVALAAMAALLEGEIRGDHFFRQTHTAANIEKLLQDGLLTVPATYNHEAFLRLFDFPLYQVCVAVLVSVTGLEVVLAARLLSIACALGTLLVTDALLRAMALPDRVRMLALVLLAMAPIQLFYGAAVLPDGMCVLLSLVALLAYVRVGYADGKRPPWLACAAGFTATLIKSPVMVPVVVAVSWIELRRRGEKAPRVWRLTAFVCAVLVGLVTHRLVAAAANATAPGWSSPSEEWYWYFSSFADRATWSPYAALLRTLTRRLLNPVTARR